jgi:hypothetical protein
VNRDHDGANEIRATADKLMLGQTAAAPGLEDHKSATNIDLERLRLDLDQKKWLAEHELRCKEVGLKSKEINRSRWTNPLVIGVFAAAVAAVGNAGVTLISSYQQVSLERERATLTQKLNFDQSQAMLNLEQAKSEGARILEVVKTNDPDKAAANLINQSINSVIFRRHIGPVRLRGTENRHKALITR